MKFRIARSENRRGIVLMMTAVSFAAILSTSTVDTAHACRPDMALWSPHCGAP
ncbi:MAG: hypothetical protein ACR2PM_00680 [Hyphomicrobiales bacterium]